MQVQRAPSPLSTALLMVMLCFVWGTSWLAIKIGLKDVPPFTGEVASYVLTEDLNFRTGPGAECDLALPQPIGAFQVVEVIGGPVVREDDGTEWVQIRAVDTDGWVAFEFLEPVAD